MNLYRNKLTVLYQFIRNKSSLAKPAKKLVKCGQPTAETHPHLIKPGEVVPNIQISEFQTRRLNLMDLIVRHNILHNKSNVNVVVIPSATKKYMSDRIPYVFRQNTDYLYLSGCLEPDSCLVLCTKDNSGHNSTLFVKNPDPHSELWDGPSTSAESAPSLFGVDNALPMGELTAFLHSYASSNKNCTFWYDLIDITQPFVEKTMQGVFKESIHVNVESPKKFIHKLRLVKSPAEIALMKKSCEIASKAFHKTMAISKPNVTEHQLFATVDYECRMNGAEYLAYPPVVAGGNRATTIHYINNNQVVSDGELVLMDAGCELHGYSSDITRTWPINGTFSPEQKLLYEVVQDVQGSLLKMLNTFPTLDNLFDSMCGLLGTRLQDVGIISKTASSQQAFKSAFVFCPHHVSHYLGMDVHDTHTVPRNIKLEPGMIITVEPGIYINENNKAINVPKEFHGLGIRIEDDVLITQNGPVVLSETCAKDPTSIENIIRSGR